MEKTELKYIKNTIIQEFNNGTSVEDLLLKYNCTYSNLYDILSSTLRHSLKDVTEYEKQEIISLYNNGLSTTKIGLQLYIYHKTVSAVLKENGIIIRRNGMRKYYLNENYFDNIDSKNKAYILGFLFADGCNMEDKYTVSMSLEETDKEILDKIRLEIGSERHLEFIEQSKRKDSNNNYHYHDMYRLLMFSKYMCDSLHDIGMVKNKSLVLEFPSCLDKTLYKDFIRGYFDGDGSLSVYTKNGLFQPAITFTSTAQFCIKIRQILQNELDIPCGNIYDAACHNGITKVLSICGLRQTKKVLDWLYSDIDESLYMSRKYKKYINTFYNESNSQSA